jgi:hypothetical protein
MATELDPRQHHYLNIDEVGGNWLSIRTENLFLTLRKNYWFVATARSGQKKLFFKKLFSS